MTDEHEHDHEHEHAHDHGAHDHAHDHGEHEHEEDDAAREAALEREREQVRRRALAEIRQYPDVALRMKASEVTEFDEYLIQLVERMYQLMEAAQGVGLAANQVGVLQRLFVFEHGEEGRHAVVNPRIDVSGEKDTDEEGCLSLEGVRVPVERSLKVTLEGKDPSGGDVSWKLEGLSARVVQHEVDHLDGVMIIDRTDAEHRKEALGTLRPRTVLR